MARGQGQGLEVQGQGLVNWSSKILEPRGQGLSSRTTTLLVSGYMIVSSCERGFSETHISGLLSVECSVEHDVGAGAG